MNPTFYAWFSKGHITEALCGLDDFFVADPTYREDHDFVLAVDALLRWAKQGHEDAAGRGVTAAIDTLLQRKAMKPALRLLRTYGC